MSSTLTTFDAALKQYYSTDRIHAPVYGEHPAVEPPNPIVQALGPAPFGTRDWLLRLKEQGWLDVEGCWVGEDAAVQHLFDLLDGKLITDDQLDWMLDASPELICEVMYAPRPAGAESFDQPTKQEGLSSDAAMRLYQEREMARPVNSMAESINSTAYHSSPIFMNPKDYEILRKELDRPLAGVQQFIWSDTVEERKGLVGSNGQTVIADPNVPAGTTYGIVKDSWHLSNADVGPSHNPYEKRLTDYILMFGPWGPPKPPDPPEDTLPMGHPVPQGPKSAPTHERLEEDRKDGSQCVQCREWFPMAEPNVTVDGIKRFKCWCCRQDPFR